MDTLKMERFHASADKRCIVQYHPQANSEFAREQGYVILRLEPWVLEASPDFADRLAALMNIDLSAPASPPQSD